jgi:PAS domain S-box-containing protein
VLSALLGGRRTVRSMGKPDYLELMTQGSAAMLQAYFTESADPFAIFNETGSFNQVNDAWTAVLGYTPAELLGRPFLTFVHPHDMARTLEAFDRANASGELVTQFVNRYRHRDGSYRTLEWTGRRVPELGVHYSTARDITDAPRSQNGKA